MRLIGADGEDASALAKRYANWMHAETLRHYQKTGEVLPPDELERHRLAAAVWLDPATKAVRKRVHWWNDNRFGNLFDIAKHVGLADSYASIYGGASQFVYATSTVTRPYKVGNQMGADPLGRRFSVEIPCGCLTAQLSGRPTEGDVSLLGDGTPTRRIPLGAPPGGNRRAWFPLSREASS